jgi:hypothetical protein
MTKTKRSMGFLLVSCWLVACGGKTSESPMGTAGSQGGGGSGGGTGGGQPDASADGPIMPIDGRCPMQGAYARNGICMCQADMPDICNNVCVDLRSDDDHCGDCATKCPATSVCNAGKCSAGTAVVLPAPAAAASPDGGAASCGPLRLVAAGGNLIWTDTQKGTVNSMPVTGGTPTVIASGQMAPTHLQVVGGNVFWLNSAEKKIMKSALTAGTPAPVVTAPATDSQLGGFAVTSDGATVYFSSSKPDATTKPQATISKVAATGGAITIVGAQDHGVPVAVAIDGTTVAFPVNGNGDVNAISVMDAKLAQCGLPPAAGSTDEIDINCSRLGRSQGGLFIDDIFAFGGSAYWLDGSQLKSGVVMGNTAGSYKVIAPSLNSNTITAFTLDGTSMFYMAETGTRNCAAYMDPKDTSSPCVTWGPATGALVQKATAAVENGTAVPVARVIDTHDATQVMGVTSVAVDATKVYFATDECGILSAAK